MLKLGFAGLGSMGLSMALCLRRAGFEVMGWNRTREKEAPLTAAGGVSAPSLAAMGEECDGVVLCLPHDGVVREVLLGPDGILSGKNRRVRYVVDCSTIDVTAARALGTELAALGVQYFDSPVSGGPQGARDGTLTIMVGGDEGTLNEVLMPVYRAMGKNILYFGPNGSAQQIKLINQILTWVNHAVLCEAGVLAKKAGLDEKKLYDCILTSYGYSRVFEVCYPAHIMPENYDNPTGMAMMVKDLELAQRFAASCGARLPMTDAAMVMYRRAIELGQGGRDQSIIMEQLK